MKLFDDVVLANQAYVDLIVSDLFTHETYYMGTVDEKNQINFYDGKIRVVDPEEPVVDLVEGEPGILAIYDLANLHSVSAILTEDVGIKVGNGFEVIGRLSGADLRGCNFLVRSDG